MARVPLEGGEQHQPRLINRTDEISGLMSLMPPQNAAPAFVILTAPSGYGKTRLTSRLLELLRATGITAVALEPQVRTKNSTDSVYQGYYVQRCAEALDQYVREHPQRCNAPTFDDFLKHERLRRATSLNWSKFLRSFPSVKVAYDVGVEVFDRVFSTGEHSSKKVLTSDSREAVDTCARYIKQVVDANRTVLVVREAQHIDHSSLQLLADIAGPQTQNSAILEYTIDENGVLNTLYADFTDAMSLSDAGWLRILQLKRLSKPHLEELLRQTLPGAKDISGEYYLRWDGNVRAIRQLKFSVLVDQPLAGPPHLQLRENVVEEYKRQISLLGSVERMCLCMLYAHGEAIPKAILWLLLAKLNPLATRSAVDLSLTTLLENELASSHPGDLLGLENEDVAEAIQTQNGFAGHLLLAKATLRDYYRQLAIDAPDEASGMSQSIRQALRLSVELNDLTTVEELVVLLSKRASSTADQSWYVSQIITAINGNSQLFAEHQDRLLLWAAELSAEVANFRTARDLLRQISSKSTFSDVLLSACLIETGNHAEAEELTNMLVTSVDPNERLAGQLIKLILLRCTGQIDAAREFWMEIDSQQEVRRSLMYGYLLRFKELVSDFPECIEDLMAASTWFGSRGLATSSAYTLLTLASHIARTGDVQTSLDCIERSRELLASTARDQHLLANNQAAVHLLAGAVDAPACCDMLIRVIAGSGDDYSDIVLYTNLGLAATLANRKDLARDAVDRALRIAKSPAFADRDVFWGVSFNLRYIDRTLDLGRREEIDTLFDQLRPHSLQNEYWQYRSGRAASAPERFNFMLSKPYHPMFLSHWTLDVDGLRALRLEHEPEALDNANPSE